MRRKLIAAFLASAMAFVGLSSPASADPQGFTEVDLGYGYFYGTFGETPNIQLLAGGTAEEFCDAAKKAAEETGDPLDPFNAEPGSALHRIFVRNDGAEVIKANARNQPIYLYETETDNGPKWIDGRVRRLFRRWSDAGIVRQRYR